MHVVVGVLVVVWALGWVLDNLALVGVLGGVALLGWFIWKLSVERSAEAAKKLEKLGLHEWNQVQAQEHARRTEEKRLQNEKSARELSVKLAQENEIWQEILEKKEAERIERLLVAEKERAEEEERSRAQAELDAKRDALVQEVLAQQGGGETFADVFWESDVLRPVTLVYGGSVPGVTVIDDDAAQVKGIILFRDVIRVDTERSQFQDPNSSRGKLLYSRVISHVARPGELARDVLTFCDNQDAGKFAARFKELLRLHREALASKAKEADRRLLQYRERMHLLSGTELTAAFKNWGIRVQGNPPVDDLVLVSVYHDFLEAIRDEAEGLSTRDLYLHIQDHVCSASLAVALRTLESTRGRIIVNSYKRVVSSRTGRDEHSCILSVSYLPEVVEKLNMQRVDPSDCMTNFPHRMSFLKTKGLQPITPIEAHEMLVMA